MRKPSFLVTIAGALVALAGCAPDNEIAGSGSAGSDASAGSGSESSGEGGSTNSGFGSGMGGSTDTSPMECASDAIVAELAPLTMFITFDKSGSMDDNNKWENARDAMKAFFADPSANELEVALRFFPKDACDDLICSVDACATPDVDIGALSSEPAPTDTHELALATALDVTSPAGRTPISAALEGAIQWSTGYSSTHRYNKMVVILVTDGEPVGCNTNIGAIANIAGEGFAQGIVTYTVGLEGSNENQLQQIAEAGGGSSFFVGNGNAQQDLLNALQAIRGEQLSCELAIPDPVNGEFNPGLVNVTYTPGGGGSEQQFGRVDSESACVPGGWYYDNPDAPETIILCPATCDVVKADSEGKLKVVLGCATQPA
jgi:hypothetical protein